MTADTPLAMASAISAESGKVSRKGRGLLEDFRAMRKAMVEEEGLINHAQAGLILEVSTKRIGELVDLGKLKRFDFLGRTYVSAKEICERREMDLKAGRPKRTKSERWSLIRKTIKKIDVPQLAAILTTESPEERKRKKRK